MKRIPWLLPVLLPLLSAAGCAVNPVTGRQQFMLVSDGQEVLLGANAAPEVEKEFDGVVHDPDLAAYVDRVGQKIAAVSHRKNLKYRYHVVNSAQINAFALPGGYIYVTRGLMEKMTNEAQLAAVLGHETAHVAARHGAARMSTMLGFQFLTTAALLLSGKEGESAERARTVAQVAAVGFNIAMLGYAREDEAQADEVGTDYAVRAGYNPAGMVQLLRILRDEAKRDPSAVEEFFQTHPAAWRRIEAVEKQIAAKYPDAKNDPKLVFHEREYMAATAGLRNSAEAYRKFDRGRKGKGDPRHSLALLSAAVEEDPGNPLFRCGRGDAWLVAGDELRAEGDYRKALSLDPGSYDARVGLGRVALRRRDFRAAAREFQAAIERQGSRAAAHYWLGEALLGLGDRAGARREFGIAAAFRATAPEAKLAERALARLGK
jgi:predicted Zn-dependent protease